MVTHLKHFFQTILFYLFESAISAVFISFIYNILFQKYFSIKISFIEILAGIFCIKIILTNIFSVVLELDKQEEYNKQLNND